MARYHIQAYGAADRPDLDYEADEVPSDLHWHYVVVYVTLQVPISLAEIRAGLDLADAHEAQKEADAGQPRAT